MRAQHSGSCLCGEVRFTLDADFERFFLCHCRYCRKDSGSAHAANLFASTAQLHWLSGREQVQTYTLPGTRHTRAFCLRCGSALPWQSADGRMLVVPAGSLDSAVTLRPDAHLFNASKADWDVALETLPRFERFPE